MEKSKNIIAGLAVLFLALASLTVLFCISVNNDEKAHRLQTTRIAASDIYSSIEGELAPTIAIANTMAHDSHLIDVLQNEEAESEEAMVASMAEYLQELKDGVGCFTSFVVSDTTKRYYSYEGLNKIISPETDEHDIWYSIFVDGRKAYDLDIDTDQVNGDDWTVFVNCRIEDRNNKLLGVCGIGMKMDGIQDTLREYEEAYNVKVNLVNEYGIVQVDTAGISIDSRYLYNIKYGETKDYINSTEDDGTYVITKYIDDLGLYLAVKNEISSSNIYMPVIIKALICYIIAAVLYVGVCVFINKDSAGNKGGRK